MTAYLMDEVLICLHIGGEYDFFLKNDFEAKDVVHGHAFREVFNHLRDDRYSWPQGGADVWLTDDLTQPSFRLHYYPGKELMLSTWPELFKRIRIGESMAFVWGVKLPGVEEAVSTMERGDVRWDSPSTDRIMHVHVPSDIKEYRDRSTWIDVVFEKKYQSSKNITWELIRRRGAALNQSQFETLQSLKNVEQLLGFIASDFTPRLSLEAYVKKYERLQPVLALMDAKMIPDTQTEFQRRMSLRG